MGSWIRCKCGGLIHTNMFTGTHVYRLIEDSDYDAIEDPVNREKLEGLFFKKGSSVYRCHACGRLAIEWDEKGGPTFYLPEGKSTKFSGAEAIARQENLNGNRSPEERGTAEELKLPENNQSDELRLHELEAMAEAAYDEMYDSRYPAGCYSDAKEAFYSAIELATRMGRQEDVKRLKKRLQHVKDVFRHQFT